MAARASLASYGSLAMFHLVGVTPEARTVEEAFGGRSPQRTLTLEPGGLRAVYATFQPERARPDVVAFTAPQLSIVELRDPLDLRRYVRALEAAVITTAAAFGVPAERVEGLPGVWVAGKRKLAAVGVRVRRGVTTHGLALNVSTDLGWFEEMVPCGIPGCLVTSLERETGQPVAMEAAREALARELATALGLRLTAGG